MPKIHYEIRLENGEVFDSSDSLGEPFDTDSFEIDEGEIPFPIKVIEAMIQLAPGESKTLRLAPKEAFGMRDEELVIEVDKNKLPQDFVPDIGAVLSITIDENEVLVTVTKIADPFLTLDANHPLAGKTVTFELKAEG